MEKFRIKYYLIEFNKFNLNEYDLIMLIQIYFKKIKVVFVFGNYCSNRMRWKGCVFLDVKCLV